MFIVYSIVIQIRDFFPAVYDRVAPFSANACQHRKLHFTPKIALPYTSKIKYFKPRKGLSIGQNDMCYVKTAGLSRRHISSCLETLWNSPVPQGWPMSNVPVFYRCTLTLVLLNTPETMWKYICIFIITEHWDRGILQTLSSGRKDQCKTSSISRTKSQNLNVSRFLLQLTSLNPLKTCVKLRMKM